MFTFAASPIEGLTFEPDPAAAMSTLMQYRAYEARYIDRLAPAAAMRRLGLKTRQALYGRLRRFFAANPDLRVARGRRRKVKIVSLQSLQSGEF
jgi:hypothetical protein